MSVLVAITPEERLLGGVVYFADLRDYGTPGPTTSIRGASGIRLLGVAPDAQGLGVGRALTVACIERAQEEGHTQVILHTTRAMQPAWRLYERLGFMRSPDLDFLDPRGPEVLGFRLQLTPQPPAASAT